MKSNEQKLANMKISDVPEALKLALEIVIALDHQDSVLCPVCESTVIHARTCPVWRLDMLINKKEAK